ncbi:MAG TPA: ATP-binding cassette domain-containing protein [Conexibacter sp.]|nr:ATP-binding cassette domain-containing protein [Conexibacter sp.]
MTALLELAGVGKRHWRGSRAIPVLHDVSFTLEAGDFAAVLGDRRMGKTTLLRIAAGIDAPDEGTVSFRGRPVAGMRDAKRAELWRNEVACVWSGASWPTRKVLDTVTVPLLGSGVTRREARRRASEELARWDIGEAAGAKLHELSDAELQRVAFAEALVRRPKVLLADDPTETLNLMERNHVLANLQRVVREERIAVLISATDASGAAGINRLLVLVGNGELREAQTLQPAPVIPLPSRSQARTGDA